MTAVLTSIGRFLLVVFKAIGQAIIWTVKAIVNAVKVAAPYVARAIRAAMPYIIRALKAIGNFIIKILPHIVNGIVIAVPWIFKQLGRLITSIKDMIVGARDASKTASPRGRQPRSWGRAKDKPKVLDNSNQDIKKAEKANKFARAINRIKTAANNKAVQATAAIGALGGATIATDALVNSGQYATPEMALPAALAAVGTYALYKTQQHANNKVKSFEQAIQAAKQKTVKENKNIMSPKQRALYEKRAKEDVGPITVQQSGAAPKKRKTKKVPPITKASAPKAKKKMKQPLAAYRQLQSAHSM